MPITQKIRFLLELLSIPVLLGVILYMYYLGVARYLDPDIVFIESINFLPSACTLFLIVISVYLWNATALKHLSPVFYPKHPPKNKWTLSGTLLFLCIHFFPEGSIRHVLSAHTPMNTVLLWAVFVGFIIHFLVDIFFTWKLASYAPKKGMQLASFVGVTMVWYISLIASSHNGLFESGGVIHPAYLITGGFLLSMFVHIPKRV